MPAGAFTASPWNKVLVFRTFGNTDLPCSYIRNTSIYPSLSPDIISCWTEKDKLSHSTFYEKIKNPISPGKCQQQGKYSLGFHLLHRGNWQMSGLQSQAAGLSKTKGARNTWFTSKKRTKKGGNGENHRDKQRHLQYITFAKWSSHHATLPHSKDKHWIWMKSLWSLIPPTSRPYAHTHVSILLFFSWWLNLSQWLTPRATAAESHKPAPQKTCECSEVESKSICSCTRPSVPQIHPFHPHYHLHRPAPMTG